jgi:hypothetical protein
MAWTSIRGKLNGFSQAVIDLNKHLASSKSDPLKIGTNKAPPGKYTTENLAYPLNVEGDPQQGHYISFYARIKEPAKLKAFKAAQGRVAATMKKVHGEVGGSPGDIASRQAKHISSHGISPGPSLAEDRATVSGNNSGSSLTNAIRLKSGTTVRTKTAISLYMPPSVQVSYESKYGDQEISMLAETGYDAISAFMKGTDSKEAVMKALGQTGMIVKQMALAALETAAPGGKALFAIHQGKVITPKMELMFEGIGRRSFSFTFVFIPKSEQEAHVVKDIVQKFKVHMAADYVDGNTREMTFPDMFDIEYMHLGKRNTNLNKIATCALTKLDVEYGGDRYVSYEGGVPQTTKLSLNFTEFDIITKKHVEDGY